MNHLVNGGSEEIPVLKFAGCDPVPCFQDDELDVLFFVAE